MADTLNQNNMIFSSKKRSGSDEKDHHDDFFVTKKQTKSLIWEDPAAALANARHVFGEHGGVNMSIEASATFTVMEPETMRRMFSGELGPDRDFFIYSRHFNPTVLNLGRLMAALEGTEAAYCTASGMSAISSVLLQLCSSGGHVVTSRNIFIILFKHIIIEFCIENIEFISSKLHGLLQVDTWWLHGRSTVGHTPCLLISCRGLVT